MQCRKLFLGFMNVANSLKIIALAGEILLLPQNLIRFGQATQVFQMRVILIPKNLMEI